MSSKKGDNRSRISIWIDALKRAYIWRFLAKKEGIYLLTEFPKSGGTWAGQMIANYTGLPFPRNEKPKVEPSLLHGHRNFDKHFNNVICVFRDGRDIMVSAYYHYLFLNDKNNDAYVNHMRNRVGFDNFEDISANMPAFIKFMFTEKINLFYNFTWSEFVRNWHDKNVFKIRYEQLLLNPEDELTPVLENITNKKIDEEKLKEVIEKYSFKNLTKREPGEESKNSFIRKGISGDWKNVFTKEANEMFNKYAGDELILLGYENDDSWVNNN